MNPAVVTCFRCNSRRLDHDVDLGPVRWSDHGKGESIGECTIKPVAAASSACETLLRIGRPRVTVRAPEDQFDLRARHSRESLTRKGGPQAHAAWSPEFPAVVSEKGLRAYRRARWKQNVNQQALPAATLTPFGGQQTGCRRRGATRRNGSRRLHTREVPGSIPGAPI